MSSLCVGDSKRPDEGGGWLEILHIVVLHLIEAALSERRHWPELLVILCGAAEDVLLGPLQWRDQAFEDVLGEVGEKVSSYKCINNFCSS